jgi:phage terminase large subunit-like protein
MEHHEQGELNHVGVCAQYVEDVLAGTVVACKWVREACARFVRDLEDGPARGLEFRPAAALRACAFIELLPHIKGKWAREKKKIRLEPWQVFIVCNIFGWYKADGTRRFHTAYIEVARKNAKSTLAAGIALYMLCADGEEGAEVFSAATTGDQARIVWEVAQRMVMKERRLREHFGLEAGAHAIFCEMSASAFKPLNAEASTQDGLNPHAAIIDELHAHKTRALWDVIESAFGARSQPLLAAITTAGSDRAGICYEQRTYVSKLLDRVQEDDSYFGIIFTIDDGDNWADEDVWIKANPNLGISVSLEYLRGKCTKALAVASAVNNFLTKHLDVWVSADTAWMDMRKWDACADATLTEDQFAAEECISAIDLASKVDLCAKVKVFHRDGHYYAFGRYYLPEEAAEAGEGEKGKNSQYSGWAREDRLVLTSGNVTDYAVIKDDIRADCGRHRVLEVPYDPFQATQLSTELLKEKIPMVEMRPTVLNFSEPMKQLEALVLSGKFHHTGDPVLAWMVSNVVCHTDAKDNIYPRKERAENKIDGVVALIMALGRWLARKVQTSAYEVRGVRTV